MMCVMNRSQPRSVPNMKVKTVQPVSVISPVCYYSFDSNCFRSDWNSGFTETKDTHTHTHTPVMWSRYAMAIKSIILPHIFWRQHLPVNQISLSQKKNFMQKCCFMARDWCFCNHQKTSPAPVAITHALLSLCLCSFQLNVQWAEQTWVLTSY